MRAICLARMDKVRPVLVLTRPQVLYAIRGVTVAPITSTIKGLTSEVPVGPSNGLDHASVVSCDNIQTVSVDDLLNTVGYFFEHQEHQLRTAIASAFALLD